MSRQITEEVLRMTFDDKQFQSATAETMSTLDKLKEKLKFDNVADGFGKVTEAAKSHLNFGFVGTALDNMKQKFDNVFHEIITGSLRKFGEDLADGFKNAIKGMTTDQIEAGWDKLGEKTKAIQTIMSATRKDIGTKFADETEQMEYINEQMEKLNWFTDETSYNFVDMVGNIGKFTSNNVALEDAVTAMMGIANWAGISGAKVAEASHAMYNMSQALGSGYMLAVDWRSIENANMATAEVKRQILEAAELEGTLIRVNEDTWETLAGNEVTVSNFRSNLADKWFTSDVMVKFMKNYGEFTELLYKAAETTGLTATELLHSIDDYSAGTLDLQKVADDTGVSFDKLDAMFKDLSSDTYELGRASFKAAQQATNFQETMDATADAVSTAWMSVFEQIIGNYQEARDLWGVVVEELYDVFAQPIKDLADLLKQWKALGGRTSLLKGLGNIYESVSSVISKVKEGFRDLIPEMTPQRLVELTKKFEEFTEKIKPSEEALERFHKIGQIIGDSFTLIKNSVDGVLWALEPLVGAVKDILSPVFNALFGAIDNYEQGSIAGLSYTSGFMGFLINIREFNEKVRDVISSVLETERSAESVSGTGGLFGIIGTLGKIISGIVGIFAGTDDQTTDLAGRIDYFVGNVLFSIQKLITAITGIQPFYDNGEGYLTFTNFGYFFTNLVDLFSISRARELYNAASEMDGTIGGVVAVVFNKLSRLAYVVTDLAAMITGADVSEVKNFIGDVLSIISNDILERFVDGKTISRLEKLQDAWVLLKSIFGYENYSWLSDLYGGGLSGFIGYIGSALSNITVAIGDFVSAITGIDFTDLFEYFVGYILRAMSKIREITKDAPKWIDEFIRNINSKLDKVHNLFSGKFSIIEFFTELGEKGKKVADFLEKNVLPVFEKIKDLFKMPTDGTSITQYATTSMLGVYGSGGDVDKMSGIWKGFSDFIDKIKEGLAAIDGKSIHDKVFGVVSGFVTGITDALKAINLKAIFETAQAGSLAWLIFEAARFIHGIADVVSSFSKIEDRVAALLKSVKNLTNAFARDLNADAINKAATAALKLAAGTAIIVGAVVALIWAIDKIDNPDAVAQATVVLLGCLFAIAAIMSIALQFKKMSFQKQEADAIKSASENVKSVTGSIVGAVRGSLDTLFTGLSTALNTFAKNFNKWLTIVAFIGLLINVVAAILILHDQIKKDPDGMVEAVTIVFEILAGLLGVIGILNLVTKNISRRAAADIKAFTGLLIGVVAALLILALLGPERVVPAMEELAIVFGGILIITWLMSQIVSVKAFGQVASNLTKFAWGLVVMMIPLALLSLMSFDTITTSLIKIVEVVLTLTLLTWAVQKVQMASGGLSLAKLAGDMALLGLALVVFAAGAALIAGVDWKAFLIVGVALGVLIGLGALVGHFTIIGVGLILLAGSMLAFGLAVAAFGLGVKLTVEAFILLAKIGDTVGNSMTGIRDKILRGLMMIISVTLDVIVAAVPMFIEATINFFNALADGIVKYSGPIFNAINNIILAIEYMILAGLKEFVEGLDPGGLFSKLTNAIDGAMELTKSKMDTSNSFKIGGDYSLGLSQGMNSHLEDVSKSSGSIVDAALVDDKLNAETGATQGAAYTNGITNGMLGAGMGSTEQLASMFGMFDMGQLLNGENGTAIGGDYINSILGQYAGNTDIASMLTGTLGGNLDLGQYLNAETGANVSADYLGGMLQQFGMDMPNVDMITQQISDMSLQNFTDNIPMYGETAAQETSEYVYEFQDKTDDANQATTEMADQAVEGIRHNLGEFESAGNEAVGHYTGRIATGRQQAYNEGEWLGAQGALGANSRSGDYQTAGSNGVIGFINGLRTHATDVWNAAWNMAANALSAISSRLNENSPSKETYESGYYAVVGFVNAFSDNEYLAYNGAYSLADNAVTALNQALTDANDVLSDGAVQPTIRPVIDLSDVQNGANQIGGLFSGGVRLGVNPNGLNASVRSMPLNASGETTNNNTSNEFNINVTGGPNSNPREIADEVMYRINADMQRRKVVFA